MARILDYKDYIKLKNLLKGSEEDANLAVAIIDKCNIKVSFPWIIGLISQRTNRKYAMCSHICKSENLCLYIAAYLTSSSFILEYDLDYLTDLLRIHECKTKSKIPNSIMKIIIADYESLKTEKSSMYIFKPQLKPKKK